MATAYPRNYECGHQVCRKDDSLGTSHSAYHICSRCIEANVETDNNVVHVTN